MLIKVSVRDEQLLGDWGDQELHQLQIRQVHQGGHEGPHADCWLFLMLMMLMLMMLKADTTSASMWWCWCWMQIRQVTTALKLAWRFLAWCLWCWCCCWCWSWWWCCCLQCLFVCLYQEKSLGRISEGQAEDLRGWGGRGPDWDPWQLGGASQLLQQQQQQQPDDREEKAFGILSFQRKSNASDKYVESSTGEKSNKQL